MKPGKKFSFGDVILAYVQFTDTQEVKTRPALVLFEEYENVVVTGITSNPHMQGIPITRKEGMQFDSIIKLNYIMTISKEQVKKYLFAILKSKKQQIKEIFIEKLK